MALIASLALAAVSCFGAETAPLRVVATTEDLVSITREIGGDRVEVEPLFKGTQDPHDLAGFLNDHPDRRGALEKADLYVSAGPTLEAVLGTDPFIHIGNGRVAPGGASYLDASRGCRVIGAPAGGSSRAAGTIHGLGSPHYWLDPRNGEIIARNIADGLEAQDGAHKDEYAALLDRFLAALREREKGWAAQARSLNGLPVVAYRDSWDNLAEWLGIQVVDTLEPHPGIAPSGRRISEINRKIRDQNVAAVLIEPYLDRGAAERAVKGTGAKVLVLASSVGAAPEVRSYLDLFDYDMKLIRDAAQAARYRPRGP